MSPLTSPLLTDLYQLTMLQAYFAHGMRETAIFEFLVRTLPTLPQHLRELDSSAELYRVEIAPALRELAARLDRQPVAGQTLPANVMS